MARIYLSDVPGQDDYPEGYWENRRKHPPVKPRYKATKKDDEYWESKRKRNEEAVKELNRRKGVVMSALSDTANSVPVTGSEIKEAADNQRQQKLDEWHQTRNVIDATATVAEATAAGYGILRGLAHGRRILAQRAFDRAGMNLTMNEIQNLSKWNDIVSKIDKPQIIMNSVGGLADGYQWINADNKFDRYENGAETGMNAAGAIGGTNWFKNLPYLRRIGGDKIDAVLDGMGYSAAAWDVIKNLPPLSYQLEKARENVK